MRSRLRYLINLEWTENKKLLPLVKARWLLRLEVVELEGIVRLGPVKILWIENGVGVGEHTPYRLSYSINVNLV